MTMAMFQAQLNTMVMWFDQWNESGQTVALFKMLTRLAPTQARFVSIALDHSLTDCAELALREKEANNPGFVSSLIVENKECAMIQTVVHLPLLRPGNAEAKHCYLALIPSLLQHTVETGHLVEEARHLLSYALIHPAFRDDRKIFEPWRRSLGERIMTGVTPSGCDGQQKTRRSNSLTPPFAVTPNAEWTSQDDLSVQGKARRFSLSLEQSGGGGCGGMGVGPPLSPQSSQASSGSGSETHLHLDTPLYDNPAMRDVKSWLKSLRLHKYWRLFSQLSYEQMLSLTDDNFDSVVEQVIGGSGGAAGAGAWQVTQGARRKIILSIAKLRERSTFLALLEQDVMAGGNLMTAMDELKIVLSTPIKAYTEDEHPPYDDIPSQFTRLLGKVCTQLMVGSCCDDELLNGFLALLESTLHHEAFTAQQKKKISSWRLQISQQLRQMRAECGGGGGGAKLMAHQQVVFVQNSPCHQQHHHQQQQRVQVQMQQGLNRGGGRVPPPPPPPHHHQQLQHHHHQPQHHQQLHLQHHQLLHQQQQPSSASVPPATHIPQQLPSPQPSSAQNERMRNDETEPEINSRLESLCLSMTEHALGGLSEL